MCFVAKVVYTYLELYMVAFSEFVLDRAVTCHPVTPENTGRCRGCRVVLVRGGRRGRI